MALYYAQTNEDTQDLHTVEAFLYAPSLRCGHQSRRYIPAGAHLYAHMQDMPSAQQNDILRPTRTITLALRDRLNLLDPQAFAGLNRPFVENLGALMRDLPFFRLAPTTTVSDLFLPLCTGLGAIGAARFLAAAGMDGWIDTPKSFVLINPDAVDWARSDLRLLGTQAEPLCPPPRQPRTDDLPRSQRALDDRFQWIENLNGSCGATQLFADKTNPAHKIVIKKENTALTTLEDFVALRLAAAMGAPAIGTVCWLGEWDLPHLACEYIGPKTINLFQPKNGRGFQCFQMEQKLEIATMAWGLMDYIDTNQGNYVLPHADAAPVVIDAGGALRCYPWYGFKEYNPFHPGSDWPHPLAIDALHTPRKGRTPFAASIDARYRAIQRVVDRQQNLRPALQQVAQEIAALGGRLHADTAAHFTEPALMETVLKPLLTRIEQADIIMRHQAAAQRPPRHAAPAAPRAPDMGE